MLFYKLTWHSCAAIKKILFKLIYGRKVFFGKKTTFRKRFNLAIDGKGVVKIGSNCFFNNDCSINAQEYIEIGDNSLFGEGVKIYDHNHVFKDKQMMIKDQGYKSSSVKIGSNCWICSNVIILKGVTIGDNCVIGAGCIVTSDVEDGSIIKMKQTFLEYEKIR